MPASAAPSAMADLLARQRAAFLRDGPPGLRQRRNSLRALKAAILARRVEIEDALIADFGHRSRHETTAMEVMTVVHGINYLHRNLRRFMRPSRRHVPLHFMVGSARVDYQPLGVIGIMSPWNYPFSLALMPLATALAAGNRALIKPSEFAPATGALLAALLGELFGADEVALVTGDAATGAAFAALPFDHLIFTGSTAIGRSVMRAASENLVPVTLELGGKSPAVIGECVWMDRVAEAIAMGKLANAGQTCIAPDYVLVRVESLDDFVAAYRTAVARFYPDGAASADYTAIINDHHHVRLTALLDDARAKGAQVIELGAPPTRPHTMAPALVLGADDTMRIMQEEIFGPLLPVLPYRDIDQAIAFINARPRPLALYVFGKHGAERNRLLARTTAGNVTINNTLMHFAQDDLPFGGVGASGMGAYHGIEGFRALSHARGTFQQGRIASSNLLRPPYGRLADFILKTMLR